MANPKPANATYDMNVTRTIEQLEQAIERLTWQRNYWRRRVKTPSHEAKRRARWRAENPDKYTDELRKNRERLRANRKRAHSLIVWVMIQRITETKRAHGLKLEAR